MNVERKYAKHTASIVFDHGEPDLSRLPSGVCDTEFLSWAIAAMKEMKRLRAESEELKTR